jgi:CRP-like cAMP-binding protein
MKNLEQIMVKHAFFRELSPEYLTILVGCAANAVFDTGSYIFREGENADNFYLIREGKVSLETNVPGQGAITVQTLSKAEVLGWSWLIPPYKWCFDARAIQPTRTIALNGKCLRDKCEDDPRLGYELLKIFASAIVSRLQAARMQALDVYGKHN